MTEIKFSIDGNEITIIVQPKNNANVDLTGEGLLDPLIKKGFSPQIKEVLNKYGDEIITGITIFRTPLEKALTTMLNIVSLGQYQKALNKNKYDDYYHLGLNITTQSGKQFTFEKVEQVSLRTGHVNKDKTEFLRIDASHIPSDISLNTFVENTRQHQGTHKFFGYSASSNNCQVFCRDALISNSINNPEYIEYIMQDTGSIFKGMPAFRKFANSVTDIANVAVGVKNEIDHVQDNIQKEVVKTANVVGDNIVKTANVVSDNVVHTANVVNKGINQGIKATNRKAKKTGRKMKKFFGGGINEDGEENDNIQEDSEVINLKSKKKDLKDFIKRNRHKFGRKIHIADLTKPQLVELCNEICG
jgi:hypothetical protein